jgi:hypothetical protein
VVKEEDAFGNAITSDSVHTVTVARGNHGTASVQGSNLTLTLVNGVATFSGLSYNVAETMNLSFTTNAAAFTATSNDIVVSRAAASQLVITQQPSAMATVGVTFATQPTVKEEDAFGNIITSDSTHMVTVARGNHGTASVQGSNLTVTLANGVATFSGLSYNVTETMNLSFTTNAGGFTATSNDIVVSPKTVTTTILATSGPSVWGQLVTLYGIVLVNGAAAPTVTGTVNFYDYVGGNYIFIGTGNVTNSVASFNTSTLSVGSHTLVAVYTGDAYDAASASVATQTVTAAGTNTTLASTASAGSVFGQAVTFTATVSVASPSTAPLTGVNVAFYDGATLIGISPVNSGGIATLTTSALSVASHSILALAYAATNSNFAYSYSILPQNVAPANTTTTVTSSASGGSIYGQNVTFTAVVAPVLPGAGTPDGVVLFFHDAVSTSNLIGVGTLSGGTATLSTNVLSAGNHTIIALYGSSTNFATSNTMAAPLNQNVAAASTQTSLVSSASGGSTFGQAITFTATVTIVSPGAGSIVGGLVAFFDGGTDLGIGTIQANGQASFTPTTPLNAGSHSISAVYLGNSNFVYSTSPSVTQPIATAGTSTALSASPSSWSVGRAIAFTATVTSATGAVPTGSVTFTIDNNQTFVVQLTAGAATLNFAGFTTVGNHTISAVYNPGIPMNFVASTSNTLSQAILRDSAVALSATPNPVPYQQPVTLSATITGSGPTPTGTVTFYDGSTVLKTVALDGTGSASLSLVLATGTHNIFVTYSGDATYNPSASQVVQVVALQQGLVR